MTDPDLDDDAPDPELLAAQAREHDPDGNPDAQDVGQAEEASDVDPDPVLNDDHDDTFEDLDEGEDDGDTDLNDEPEPGT